MNIDNLPIASTLNGSEVFPIVQDNETKQVEISKIAVDAYTKQESDAFITDEYDATSTYAIGDMVIHENALYVCSTAITTAEAWNSAHWTLTDIATAIGTVKTAIPTKTSDLQNDSGFAQIDDTTESANKTWSSEKIGGVQSEVDDVSERVNTLTTRSANLYNSENTLATSYIKNDGTIAYNANYSVTEEFTIPNGKKIVLSALMTSSTPATRANANACRKNCVYKSDGTYEINATMSTAYTYTNNTGSDVKIRFQLWGEGAERSATDIYIVVVAPDVTVPASTYAPYGIQISSALVSTQPQEMAESEREQARANIGASRSLNFTNEDFFREFAKVSSVAIATDTYTNEKVATFTGNGSSTTWVRIKVPCLQSKAYVLEFWGKTTDEAYYSDASQNGMVVCEFFDKNDVKIGSQKYNAYVIGTKKLGYHKYGFISPWGSAYAQIRVVTRGNTVIQISNISFSQIERVMPRQDNGVIYFGHQGMKFVAPQNTIPSFELGIVAGFNSNVVNVNTTADDVLVCIHNDSIDSVSDGTGNVYDLTYAQLQAYDFGSWFNASYTGTKIAKFEDIVKLMAIGGQRIGVSFHGIAFNTHMTTAKVVEACNIIKKYSNKKPLIKSFALLDLTDAFTVFGDEATYMLCLDGSNFSTKIDNVHSSTIDGKDTVIELPSSGVTDSLIAQAKGYGYGVSVYFGNEPTRMKEIIKMGVTMFTVDTFSDVIIPMD